MAKISKAVFDTGPLIHLNEIELLKILKLFGSIFVIEGVLAELKRNKDLYSKVKKIKNIRLLKLKAEYKDVAKLFVEKYNIGLAEACSISLSIQEKSAVFITDDLDARTVGKNLGIEVHGTVGVIVRSFRENIISKEEATNKIRGLYEKSSLFITKDLVDWVIKELKEYKKNI